MEHILYLFTPWCRVLLDKLTGLQLVKKFSAFQGTRRFITAFTSVRHLSLSWASPIQSIYPHPIYWRSNLILSTNLRQGLPSARTYLHNMCKLSTQHQVLNHGRQDQDLSPAMGYLATGQKFKDTTKRITQSKHQNAPI